MEIRTKRGAKPNSMGTPKTNSFLSNVETIDVTLIQINWKIYPREKVDVDLVETYYLNMESGIKFPPLVVNKDRGYKKDTYTLIDGFHRYYALKKLGKEKVEVEILNLPRDEMRAEAARRNIKHGKRLSTRELRRTIVNLRFDDRKKLKEIAEIVGRTEPRISQICEEFRMMPRYFNDLNSKVPKIDLRIKAEPKTEEKILKDIKAGLPGKEIAKKYDVSQPTVSRIKKEYKTWASSPLYIRTEPGRAISMFKIAFINKLLKKARFEFKEEGVVIRNSDGGKHPLVIAAFGKAYFEEYLLRQPIEGYVEPNIIPQIDDFDVEFFDLALLDSNIWKMRARVHYSDRFERQIRKKSQEYNGLGWRDFPTPDLKLDADGIPETVHVKAQLLPYNMLPRKQKGMLSLIMKDGTLTCAFKCRNGWDCHQTLNLKFLEKKADARATVDIEALDEVLRTIGGGDVWFGMWSDHTNLAIGQTLRYRDGRLLYKICFII